MSNTTTPLSEQYRALVDSYVKHFRSDIDIDCKLIEIGTPCLFFTRECGTHCITMRPFCDYPPQGVKVPYLFGQADRVRMLDGQGETLGSIELKHSTLVLHFDGKAIHTIDFAQAVEINKQYTGRMIEQFEADNGHRYNQQ